MPRLPLLLGALLGRTMAYDNGMAKKPPMGWQSWCSVGHCGTDKCYDGQIRAMADTLVSSGMKDLGYDLVLLDDCWHPYRDENDTFVPFERWFPEGMKPVVDYTHSLGLRFGLYTSVGDKTCHGGWSPGSYGFYEKDAQTFADWGVDYVKIDYCGDYCSADGHINMSRALNATGRPIHYELCRGEYAHQDHWGYAPEIAQSWRATGDHHDVFTGNRGTKGQVDAMRGRSSWSGPHGWATMDMMMIGGEGCDDQCEGRSMDDSTDCNWTEPAHCPGQTDNEYRTEMTMFTIASSPLMVGTDIRLMTPIMTELLLNEEAIAINQDYEAVPGDAVLACVDPEAPAVCSIELEEQQSHNHDCLEGVSYGCINGTRKMWASNGCRGKFKCNGKEGIECKAPGLNQRGECDCEDGAPDYQEVWVRRLTDGDLAVALPNWLNETAELTFCLDTLKWAHGDSAHARSVWAKQDLGVFSTSFTATLEAHDTLLLRISPASLVAV